VRDNVGFVISKLWGILVNLGRLWSKEFTNSPLALGGNYCIPTFGGRNGCNLLTMASLMPEGWNYSARGIRCVDDMWDGEEINFFSLKNAQRKFNLTPVEASG
jgi:hypothetical protein